MLGIIRVLTTEDKDVLHEHGRSMEEYLDIRSESACIPDQWNGIHDDETEAIAVPKIVSLAKEMEATDKFNAITISCAADPALSEVRNTVSIPVFGAGACGAYAASMVGDQIGVIGITDEGPMNIIEILGRKYHSYAYSPDHRKTTDLFAEGAKEKLSEIAQKMIGNGADTILFACTGFSTIRLKAYLQNVLSVPVIDLVEAQAIAYQITTGGRK